MTERKPRDTSFTSWIDRQIAEAEQRGAFDNLPGTGRPLPRRDEDAGQAWLRDYLRREGVSSDDLLPEPLKLRTEAERLAGSVPDLRSEQEVREAVTDLNDRILRWRRVPTGPPVFLPLVDEDAMLARWRAARPTPPAASSRAASAASDPDPGRPAARRRWWHRLTRRTRAPLA
jgi:Domain of unknown function (DUF1992)